MGYDIHIHRRLRWYDGGNDIPVDEWNMIVQNDLELANGDQVETTMNGEPITLTFKNAILTKWTKPISGETAYFDYNKGRITVRCSDDFVLLKAQEIAKKLNAKVQGDEGEVYYLPRNNSSIRLDYRKLRKANLPIDFPMIDDISLEAKTVTRMEVLDVSLKEYQDVNSIDVIIRSYINELSIFYMVDWKSYFFRQGREFEDRYLELGIPLGRATPEQIQKLLELQEHAQTRDVTLIIVEVP